MPLREEGLLENIKPGNLFGFVQCDIEVPENLGEAFANFPPIFKNNNVGSDDLDPFIKKICRERRTFDSTYENAEIKLYLGEWNNRYTIDALLSGLAAGLQEKLIICAIHSDDVLQ